MIKRKKPPEVEVSLPTEPTPPMQAITDFSFLIYGERKIGKTSLASHFNNPMFLLFEPGGKALSLYSANIQSWIEFKKLVTLLCKSKKFTTVVIDTAQLAYESCEEYVCTKLGIDHPSDEAFGKGWRAVDKEFKKQINRLLHKKAVVFVAHSEEKEIKKRTGDSYHMVQPELGKQARRTLESVVDIWLYYGYDQDKRQMYIQGSEGIMAGHRLGEEGRFQYPGGQPVKIIGAGHSSKQAYDNLNAAFNNTYTDSSVKAAPVAMRKKFRVRSK